MKKRRELKKKSFTPAQQWLIGLFVLLVVSVFSLSFIAESAAQPFENGKQAAIQVAKDHVGLVDPVVVSLYNGSESYYSVVGVDATGQSKVVLISQVSSDIFVYNLDEGISQEEAEKVAQEHGATAIEQAVIGRLDGKPVWEVKSQQSYYLISFEDGQLMKKIGL